MLRAKQAAVVQNANAAMASLRQSETIYFSQFFSTFGIQAGIIVGFVFASLSQTPALEPENGFDYSAVYWIASTISLAAGIYVIVGSLFISVYGEGLALRGPVGSMVKAVDGMAEDQLNVLSAFCVTCITANVALIGMYFIVMEYQAAVFCAVVNILGLYSWYASCIRIYNRFKFDLRQNNVFARESMSEHEENEIRNVLHEENANDEIKSPLLPGGSNSSNKSSNILKNNESQSSNSSIWSALRSNRKNNSSSTDTIDQAAANAFEEAATLHRHGYFTMKENTLSNAWTRRYAVLRGPYLNFYRDARSYEINPKAPLNMRPLVCLQYHINTEVTDDYFMLLLIPNEENEGRKTWEFRFDTLNELREWKAAFVTATSVVNNSSSNGDHDAPLPSGSSIFQGNSK